MEKWKFLGKNLIHNQVFHNTTTPYSIYSIICHRSKTKKNLELVYLKWKELNQIVLGLERGSGATMKGHLCLTKMDLDNPGGNVEVESLQIGSCLGHF